MIRQENSSNEHIADLIFQLSRLDRNGAYEPINTVHHEVACALFELMECYPMRVRYIFEAVVLGAGFSVEKQKELLDSIEASSLL